MGVRLARDGAGRARHGYRHRRHACVHRCRVGVPFGAETIVLLDDLDEALALKAADPGSLAFRDGPLTIGFELANSLVRCMCEAAPSIHVPAPVRARRL